MTSFATACCAARGAPRPPAGAEFLTSERGQYWPIGSTLRVAFLGGSAVIQARVIVEMSAWSKWANIRFVGVGLYAGQPYDLLVSFNQPGYWSVIGTDARGVPRGQPTMNLQGFDSGRMPDSEWKRVVRHETGHALGAMHEQQRPDEVSRLNPEAVYAWALQTQGWDRAQADAQILTPLNMALMDATPKGDERSIMMYFFDGSLTKDGKPIVGGEDIDETDGAQIATIYPGVWSPTQPSPTPVVVGGSASAAFAGDGSPVVFKITAPHKGEVDLQITVGGQPFTGQVMMRGVVNRKNVVPLLPIEGLYRAWFNGAGDELCEVPAANASDKSTVVIKPTFG